MTKGRRDRSGRPQTKINVLEVTSSSSYVGGVVHEAHQKRMRAKIVHNSARRLRLRIPALRNDGEFLKRIAEKGRNISGVKNVSFNPATGSVLIEFAEDAFAGLAEVVEALSSPELGLEIEPLSGLAEAVSSGSSSELFESFSGLFRGADAMVRTASANKFDMKILLPLGATAAGLASFRKRMPTPLWITMLIFAFTSFAVLDQRTRSDTQPQRQDDPGRPMYMH
jgi:hypothetical protein